MSLYMFNVIDKSSLMRLFEASSCSTYSLYSQILALGESKVLSLWCTQSRISTAVIILPMMQVREN